MFQQKFLHHLLGLLCYLLALLQPSALSAQSSATCNATFNFGAITTNSTCQSNGTITVNLSGYYGYFTDFHYSVEPNTENGKQILPQRSNVLTGLPPGTHRVRVTGRCKADNDKTYTAERLITVEGNYEVIKITGSEKTQGSHADCRMGRIAFRVSGGRSTRSYRIIAAPASANLTLPYSFTPTQDGESYIVPGRFPAGDYTLSVADECYEAVLTVNLSTLPLPEPAVKTEQALWALSSEEFFKNKENPKGYYWTYDCYAPMVDLHLADTNPHKKELEERIEAGEYEVGWALPGQEVPSVNWRIYGLYSTLPVPQQMPDGQLTLDLHVRRRDCTTASAVYTYQINNNFSFNTDAATIFGHDCNTWRKKIEYSPHLVMCYPMKVYYFNEEEWQKSYYDNAAPPANWTKTKTLNSYLPLDSFYVDYSPNYRYVLMLSSNRVHKAAYGFKKQQVIRIAWAEKYCKGRILNFRLVDHTGCFPLTFTIKNQETNEEVYRKVITDLSYHKTPLLLYDTPYIARIEEKDYNGNITPIENRSLTVNWISKSYSKNKKHTGAFIVDFEHLPYRNYTTEAPPNGAKWELISPNGTVIHTGIFDEVRLGLVGYSLTTGQDLRLYPNRTEAYYPPGQYTLRITEGDCVKEFSYAFAGFYDSKNFTYTFEKTCRGWEVTPQGQATLGGENVETLFRVVSGPPGAYNPQTHIKLGERFIFTQDGTYGIGLRASADVNDAYDLDTIFVSVRTTSVRLDPQNTMAYSCQDNINATGHIFTRALDGIPPYRYELWTIPTASSPSARVKSTADRVNEQGVAYWNYGHVGESYIVRAIDACQNQFPDTVKIQDLSSMIIASTPDALTCIGEDIQLHCKAMERYEWYNPQNILFSTEQNPVIPHAQRRHSGLYHVKGYVYGCGDGVEGWVEINVEPCWAPVNPNLMHRVGSMK